MGVLGIYIMCECKGMVPVKREFQFFIQFTMTSHNFCFFIPNKACLCFLLSCVLGILFAAAI